MGELTKVRKEFIAKYDILSDVIVSPVRIEILRSLSEYSNGLSFEEIVNHIPEDMRNRNIQKHLDQLITENVVTVHDSDNGKKYFLTDTGKVTYKMLVKAASEIKAESSQTNSQ